METKEEPFRIKCTCDNTFQLAEGHDQIIEHTWAKTRARHQELVKQFMEDGWQEQNGLTMEEALAAIRAAKAEDAPTIRRTEKQLDALRAKGGRTAQARAINAPNGEKVVSPEHYVLKFKTSSAFKDHQMGRKANAENGRGKN